MKKVVAVLLLLSLLFLLLAGCGNTSSTHRADFKPIRPDPTSTPTVTGAGNAVLAAAPTSVVPDQVPVSNYTHSTNRFSINYPNNWQFYEQPNGVIFVEPGDQAGYSVVFSDVGETYSAEELNRYLVTYVAQNFVDQASEFMAINQTTLADNSVVAQFATSDSKLGRVINEVRVKQQDTIVQLLLINATEVQWPVSQHKLEVLAESLTLLDSSPILQPTPTTEPPTWVLIGSTNQQFGFLYPSDWKVAQQAEDIVVVTMPEYGVSFEGSVTETATPPKDPAAAAEKAALTFVDTLATDYKNVQQLPPTEFPLDTVSGATIDFLYTSGDGTDMAGSVITATSEGKIYRVVFTAPADFYQTALQWFNPMYKSFKILNPADVLLGQ